jgi:putative lipoprotein
VFASSLMAVPQASGPALRWSSCATLVVSLFFASQVSAQTQAPDRWWARDSVSFMLAADGYAVASVYTDRPAWRALWGAAFSLSAGLAKEFYDESRGRTLSGRDLAWDALGTATGTTVAWLIDRCFFENPRRTQ